MARAQFRTGFYLVVGLVAGAATAAAQTPGVLPAGSTAVMEVGNPHEALNQAIEAQRRGDYENAARLLQGAAVKQALLTTVEQQELTRLLTDNGAALDARHAASDQLRQAVAALNAKRQAEAVELLKKVAVNEQYLAASDRQLFHQYSAGLNLPGAAPAVPVDPAAQARLLVRQARIQLVQGDFDKTDELTKQAVALQVAFAANEDSPVKLID
ncbi:MAG TPA: hypothetical protein VMS17_06730, partial [Gemmataceae bacterium]|nr:hypothetical protein [Gemmataceae bacterium]